MRLERADVAGAHDVRAGAEIEEVAVAIERDRFVLGNVLDDVELELARLGSRTEGAKFATFRHGQRFVARNFHALERMVRLDLLLHLRLDLLEIVGRDAMRQLDVVIETVLHRRPGGELRIGPDFQNGRGQDVRGGMAEALDVGHLGALLECLAVVAHGLRDSSVRAGLAYSLGMTKARSPAREPPNDEAVPDRSSARAVLKFYGLRTWVWAWPRIASLKLRQKLRGIPLR